MHRHPVSRPDARRAPAAAAVALLLALVAPSLAQAQDATSDGLGGLMEGLHLKAKVPTAADFVTRSRPSQEPGFIPVGTPHPDRPVKVMTPAEVAAAEADLDAARVRQQRRAGQVPAAVPLKAVKGPVGTAKNTVR